MLFLVFFKKNIQLSTGTPYKIKELTSKKTRGRLEFYLSFVPTVIYISPTIFT